jgi:dihydrofolate synthase / folylpolyglutamate synthase
VSSLHSDAILERLVSLHPKVIDLTLGRIKRLLDLLGHPEKKLPPVIHIAGTNGKGSTQAMLRAGLESAGKTVHAYTSPHLARFHERIRLAGTLVSEPMLASLLEECEIVNGQSSVTFFEITTAAAFLGFARTKADYCLLEVGLGGRLDATNVIDKPLLSVITSVSIDHQQYLGNTLAEIAGEKAGILKRGVPAIVGPQQDESLHVIEVRAARLGAPLKIHGQHWHVFEERGRLIFQDEDGLLDLPMPVLIGAHQVQNAGIVIAALRSLGFSEDVCAAAVTQAEWPARLQRLRKGPLIDAAPHAEFWLDGGHNEAAGHALAEALGRLPARPTHIICGMLNTKDIAGYLRPLTRCAQSLHGVSIPGEAATLSAQDTVTAAKKVGFQAVIAMDVVSAVQEIANSDPNSRILICGSLYLAGNVLRQNG